MAKATEQQNKDRDDGIEFSGSDMNEKMVNTGPLFLPKGSVRDIIAIMFAIGFLLIANKLLAMFSSSDPNRFDSVFTVFVSLVNLIIGYYFGNRSSR